MAQEAQNKVRSDLLDPSLEINNSRQPFQISVNAYKGLILL